MANCVRSISRLHTSAASVKETGQVAGVQIGKNQNPAASAREARAAGLQRHGLPLSVSSAISAPSGLPHDVVEQCGRDGAGASLLERPRHAVDDLHVEVGRLQGQLFPRPESARCENRMVLRRFGPRDGRGSAPSAGSPVNSDAHDFKSVAPVGSDCPGRLLMELDPTAREKTEAGNGDRGLGGGSRRHLPLWRRAWRPPRWRRPPASSAAQS